MFASDRNTPTLYYARYISKYFSHPLLQYAPLVYKTAESEQKYRTKCALTLRNLSKNELKETFSAS